MANAPWGKGLFVVWDGPPDPELGRFLSPDPLIQAPYNTQSYNRYSYVFNNPLNLVDPSGYEAVHLPDITVTGCTYGYQSSSCAGGITQAYLERSDYLLREEREQYAQREFSRERYMAGLKERWNDSGPGRLFNSLNRSLTWSIGLGGGAELKLYSTNIDFHMGGGVALEGVYSPEGSYGRLQSDFSVLSLSIDGLGEGSLINIGQTDTFTYDSYLIGDFNVSPGSLQILNTSPISREWGFGVHVGIIKFTINIDLDKF